MDSNTFEGSYDLSEEELASLGELDSSSEDVVLEPKESDADVEDQPEDDSPADDKSEDVDTSDDKSDDGKPEEADAKDEPSKVDWRQILGRDDIEWDGFLQAKLEELPPEVAQQRQYLSRLATEYQNKMKEMEEKTVNGDGQQAQADPIATPVEEPPMPSFDDDQATFTAKQKVREEWLKQEAVRVAETNSSELTNRMKAMEQRYKEQEEQKNLEFVASRYNYIKSIPGWTPEVEKELDILAEEHPGLGAMASTDDGAQRLVKFALSNINERHSKAEKVTHETSAATRTVPRAKSKSSARSAKDDIVGDNPEEWIDSLASRDEYAGLFDK